MILDAAQKRLTEGGPEAIRLQDIAADVGISHPTILHHFGNRDGLLEALEGRAMADLQRDLMTTSAGLEDTLDRVFATLGDQGHARLLAWWALGSRQQELGDDAGMLREIGDAVHADRVAAAREASASPPTREDTDFTIRLLAAALVGEALLGPLLSSSAGLGDDDAVRTRFHRWLARWIEADH